MYVTYDGLEIEIGNSRIKCNSEAEVKSVAYMGYSMRYYERRIGRGRILCINTFSSPYSSFIHKVIGVLLGRGVLLSHLRKLKNVVMNYILLFQI